MLSRVAENIYWLGRYIERAENTARIVNVNAHLLLDLPKGFSPGWQAIIAITGFDKQYRERYEAFDERNVIKFLVGDTNNGGSILSSLAAARENGRTIRDFVPREAWEEINELYLFAKDHLQSGLSKRGRYRYLKRIFRSSQTLSGLLAGTMNHDAGYDFLRTGRNLERADMTTRIIDVRTASLLPDETLGLRAFENIQWMSVLKSLTAYQMYRRKMQVRVRRVDVLRFLFQDREFPRSFYHCLSDVEASLARLPHNEAPLRILGRLKRAVEGADLATLSPAGLHELIDQLQIDLGHVHDEIALNYFLVQTLAAEAQ